MSPSLPASASLSPIQLLDLVDDVLCLCDGDTIVWINESGASQLGGSRQKLIGTSFRHLLHPDHRRHLDDGLGALADDPKGLPMILARPDGGTMAALVLSRCFGDNVYGVVLRDLTGRMPAWDTLVRAVTRLEERARDLSRQASFDSLTGLPNRTLFMDRLNQAVHQAERNGQMVGLMFIDLDGFKLVNDTLGHDMGDLLLQETGRRLAACIRSGDTVARLGGDEFTVLMPNLGTYQNAPAVAGRILDTLKKPFDLAGREAFVSGSIGITVFPDDAADALSMLKNADAAMYRAKEHGKANFQFFTTDMNAAVEERLAIKTGLSQALERGEMTLAFQPKLDLKTGAYTGVEALLRWNAAALGQVSPAKFIPVMEESGLMGRVGEWAIDAACRQYRDWLDHGKTAPRIAINLSVRQLRAAGFVTLVKRALERTDVPASALEFEITEGMVSRDSDSAVAILRELADMGIGLAMDDFGTGTSSLSVIRRFPIDSIKIDRAFIADIATDASCLEITRAIISMGHALGRRIIAEGVETTDQVVVLRQLGCDEIQGYVLAPPVPADQLAALLTTPSHV
ncbi:putative bifunctional diguanylate cyclase/phosphodiesterase [Magnetospirillum sulfuroxidans]|uniref:EAL domain-containing protein n=1 Tax=Magnetospirillum sulfuroxidans TaxID=611300 RepID=A0ABS5IAG7_9PROT|nr:EAL domain-containing protein [Magnetospirillum sulfuroxidans]MBR9971424.1 EAL domain-containing protein [Magnetospirillum sulfuroxidans]